MPMLCMQIQGRCPQTQLKSKYVKTRTAIVGAGREQNLLAQDNILKAVTDDNAAYADTRKMSTDTAKSKYVKTRAAIIEQTLSALDNILKAVTDANAAYADTKKMSTDTAKK